LHEVSKLIALAGKRENGRTPTDVAKQ